MSLNSALSLLLDSGYSTEYCTGYDDSAAVVSMVSCAITWLPCTSDTHAGRGQPNYSTSVLGVRGVAFVPDRGKGAPSLYLSPVERGGEIVEY